MANMALHDVFTKFRQSKVRLIALTWLALITLLAASASFKGIVPVDARTSQPLAEAGVALDLPWFAVAIEPFTAIASIIVGAPDYRIAAISLSGWLFAVTWLAAYLASRHQLGAPTYLRAFRSCGAALVATLTLALYLSFMILIPLPSWSLIADNPEMIVADLHSHTLASHDGIASTEANLAYHRARGYNVAAITNHFSQALRSMAPLPARDDQSPPEIINGVEIGVDNFGKRKAFFLILGVPPNTDLPYHLFTHRERQTLESQIKQFIASIHDAHGAVLALSYRLDPEDIERFAEAGVDGFEVANFGHPDMTTEVRGALINVQASHGVSLVANSDWHGWGGFARTWTVLKPAVTAASDRRSQRVIDVLRQRSPEQVIPVVTQYMGRPSALRGILAPLFETIRYARELSPLRLMSWWLWVFILFGIAAYLSKHGYRPTRCFMGATLVLLGSGLLIRGLGLFATWFSVGLFRFPLEIGVYSGTLGIISLLLGGLFIFPRLSSRLNTRFSTTFWAPKGGL